MQIGLLTFKKIKDGDIRTFEALFRSSYEPLCGYACSFVGNMDVAEEIVQDLFYTIWRDRESLHIIVSVKAYLYRAVKYKSLQYAEHLQVRDRHREAVLTGSPAVSDETPLDKLEYKELEQQVNETLEHLPERRRKIFQMNRFEGKKYSEIAQELSISVKTVEAEISKALQELRSQLKAES